MSSSPDAVAPCLGVWGCVYCMREAAAWVKKDRATMEDLEKELRKDGTIK